MRIVCGLPWTIDGRWVVVGSVGRQDDCLACVIADGPCEYHIGETIVYDPDNGVSMDPILALFDIRDCQAFIRLAQREAVEV